MAKLSPITIIGAAIFLVVLAGCAQNTLQPGNPGNPSQYPENEPVNNTGASSQPEEINEELMQEVMIKDFAFSPSTLTVKKGTTVTWTNEDSAPHTATSGDVFDSGNLGTGQSFSYTFDEAGTFDYICTIHPSMEGAIIVGDSMGKNIGEESIENVPEDMGLAEEPVSGY